MKKLVFLLGLSLMFLLMGQAKATYTQTLYYYNVSSDSQFETNGYASINPLNGTCNTTLRVYADVTSTPTIFYSYQIKMIENGTTLFTSMLSGTQPKTCENLGSISISKGIVNVTARATALAGSQNVTLYLEIATSCETNNDYIYINGTIPYANKSYEYNMYAFEYWSIYNPNTSNAISSWNAYTPKHCTKYREVIPISFPPASSVNWTMNLMNTPLFGSCTTTGRCDYNGFAQQGGSGYSKISPMWFVSFNSKLGQAQLDIEYSTSTSEGGIMGIFNPQTQALVWNQTFPFPTAYVSVNVSLEQFKDYVAFFFANRGTGGAFNKPPVMNITILDYTPNWVCGTWSNCVAGQQQRLCNDTGGMLAPEYQFRNCLAVNQTAVLGFEKYYIPADRQVCVPGYLCLGKTLLNKSPTWFPDNPRWAIIPDNILYYTTVVSPEEHTEGSRSLKMWYVPPSHQGDQAQQVVIGNTTTVICNDSLEGFFPDTFIVLNTTFAASLDFTFPAGTTVLKFDVKRCNENAVQYNNICGKRCYSQNCSVPPSGWFIAQLYDQVEAKSVFELTKEASANWTTYSAGLGNAVEDRNYTLVFSVLPLPWDSVFGYGNCVYFDNVRLINTQVSQIEIWCDEVYGQPCNELTDEEIQTVLIEKCVTECIGNDYYIRTIEGLTCMEEIDLNYSTCVTQYQQQQTGNQSIFLPISSISGAVINETTGETLAQSWQASGFGFALVFLTPIFWIMLIIAITMVVASYVTKHMEIGMGAGLVILIAFTFALPELIIITIMLIVITAYIVGRAVVKAASGGE